jgi:hypothetical protein
MRAAFTHDHFRALLLALLHLANRGSRLVFTRDSIKSVGKLPWVGPIAASSLWRLEGLAVRNFKPMDVCSVLIRSPTRHRIADKP